MAHEFTPEIKELIYKEWVPRILAGVLQGVRELPPEHRDYVMMKMAKTCADMAVWALGIRPEMSFEDLKKHLTDLEPPMGPRTIERVGKIVHSTYHCSIGDDGKPVCECPVVKMGIMEPFPELCSCGANMAAYYFETIGMPTARSELMGSPNTTGEAACQYVIHLKTPQYTTPEHEMKPEPKARAAKKTSRRKKK
jgi:hypothetical protein